MTQQNKIEIYTVSYCPFCKKAKNFFSSLGFEYIEHQCDENENHHREELTKKYNLNSLATFPQIEINGEYIGGYSDLIEKYNKGLIKFN